MMAGGDILTITGLMSDGGGPKLTKIGMRSGGGGPRIIILTLTGISLCFDDPLSEFNRGPSNET